MANAGQIEIDSKDLTDQAKHNVANILPTAPEIGYLWSSYLAESMSVCMLKYIVANQRILTLNQFLSLH